MATCPSCGRSSHAGGFTLRDTGRLTDIRPAAIAGQGVKFEAKPERELRCPCGWFTRGWVERGPAGDQLVTRRSRRAVDDSALDERKETR